MRTWQALDALSHCAFVVLLSITLKGTVPIPHPKKDLPIGTVRSALKQAGLL
ncbi:type II toxin-antitoxin system HicA family toxin [Pigmentiphaga aceris]|uniref:Type II toxin-antitoxin system HicA family toxin n=1 Tax=Pigmentiphaga aceris TaxID=1940612 RepID=A0A5C0B950_9BURK|nr:type II toxin-antitoxin system HicA family toxin [Pigmentiphaga aceris]